MLNSFDPMPVGRTNRRAFIAGLGGAAAWPMVGQAQQPKRVRRVGLFFTVPPSDPVAERFTQALLRGLAELRWIVGTNLEIVIRFGGLSDIGQIQAAAKELVATQPDLIQTAASPCFLFLVVRRGRGRSLG